MDLRNNFLKFSENLRVQKLINFQKVEEKSKISTKSYFLFDSTWHLFLKLSEKKCPTPKWTLYKHVSDNSKKCLSVGNFGILSVVVCLLSSGKT